MVVAIYGIANVAPASVTSYQAFRSVGFVQTNAEPSFVVGDASYWYFEPFVLFDAAADVDTAEVRFEGAASPMSLTRSSATDTLVRGFSGFYSSESEFLSDFPERGSYTYVITQGDLVDQVGELQMPASPSNPSVIPRFVDFDPATQQVSSANATFHWNRWDAADPSLVFFLVWKQGGALMYSTFLPPGTTTYTLPAGTLQPNSGYLAEVIFSSRTQVGLGRWQGDGAPALLGCDYRTQMRFRTLGVGLDCPADIVTYAPAGAREAIVYYPEASDPMTVCEPRSGSLFPIGTNLVVCTRGKTETGVESCTFTVTVYALPILEVTRGPGPTELTISWSTAVPAGFILEATASLTAPDWQVVSGTVSEADGRKNAKVPVDPGGGAKFFRLRGP